MRIPRSIRVAGLAAAALAAVLVIPAAAGAGGGGCHYQERTSASGSRVVLDKSNCFSPHILYAEEGAEVEFVSQAPVPHNVSGLDWNSWAVSSTGELADGDTFVQRFTEPGYYPYACTLHVGMVGVIIVGEPDQVAAATAPAADDDDDDGSLARWALLGTAGVLALGLVGGGAYLRNRTKR